MESFVEAFYKSGSKITFGWSPEPGNVAKSYSIYVGQVSDPASLTLLKSGLSARVSDQPPAYRKVTYEVTIDAVRTALSLAGTLDFENLVLYFAITYTDSVGSESPIAESTVVEVPPVGILGKTRKEDPSANRHLYGFSDERQRWLKVASSGSGAIITSASELFAVNTVTEYSRDASGNPLTVKSYFADRTTAGSPAKLTAYEYDGSGFVSKITITDSTV